ncbi:PREDICTED: midasin-like [Priapulus caudatus]|uniref:Midasin n=1 Tax=Priapulus caudatus TaxID=37621 RepID=A0ABM1EJT2_PRICU|nr:PREDICTED: midasin-like [Priapulus caudatus]
MKNLGLNISVNIEDLCKANRTCAEKFQGYLAKQIWTPSDRQTILATLARLLLNSGCTESILTHFVALVPELLQRAIRSTEGAGFSLPQHERLSVALSIAVQYEWQHLRQALQYLRGRPPFFQRLVSGDHNGVAEPTRKKAKKTKVNGVSDLEIVETAFRFLSTRCAEFRELWDWSPFLQYLDHADTKIKWLGVSVVAMVMGMSNVQRRNFERKYFDDETILNFSISCDDTSAMCHRRAVRLCQHPLVSSQETDGSTHTLKGILGGDLCESVVSVCGVLLPSKKGDAKQNFEELIPVQSTTDNMHALALAVASGTPALLQGPVGCGKTALVENLAQMLGRSECPELLKVQLGDQMDSKALIGTYRCTDVPGEFVWQPGSLTQAVTNGYLLLLEDIDYAPMDVVSVLMPLMESGELTLPGRGDSLKAAPGFQLFATLRLSSGGSGQYKGKTNNCSLLDKLWTQINIEPMSRSELRQVVTAKFPSLASVADRLLDIYFMLSAGGHEHDAGADDAGRGDDSELGKHIAREGRLTSARDLFKWCARVAKDFNRSSEGAGIMVFQEALDCFGMSIPKVARRVELAEAIAGKLNILRSKAEFFCTKYKPNVEVTSSSFDVGRVALLRKPEKSVTLARLAIPNFAFTRLASTLLESIAVAVGNQEPVLLVGETGSGKTATVQYLAWQTGHALKVVNMNQQSDSADLLGGFKPVDLRHLVLPLKEEFENVFCKTFSRKQNIKFLNHIQECFSKRRWEDLFRLMVHSQQTALKRLKTDRTDAPTLGRWEAVGQHIGRMKKQVRQSATALAFSFIEGALVTAIRNGDWILLDELNLATAETLECLSGLLESTTGSVLLLERGDTEPVVRHPDFRLFACMNPATDVGKKDLPPGVRNRFTELFVDELTESSDLKVMADSYLRGLSLTAAQLDGIVTFYLRARDDAQRHLADGTGHRPHYSLRTLCRALQLASRNMYQSVPRSLYEHVCICALFTGVLVDAMRRGHWVILDELNLAPTDVLEALNRLLDDNRELFITETQQMVAAHPRFMLFATQNPPGLYGGRKMLSRAFRNRFVELHFDELPSAELETILHERCQLPRSYCRKLVTCMRALQVRRRSSGVFAGKQGFITLRDLFRWAERYRRAGEQTEKYYDWDQHLVDANGYAECGKTTICQLFAALAGQQLYSVNCHMHTETSDFLGGLRPVRHHDSIEDDAQTKLFEWCDGPLVRAMKEGATFLVDEISLADDAVLERLNSVLETERALLLTERGGATDDDDGGGGEVERLVAAPTFRVVATMNPGGDFGKKELSPALRNRFTEIWCPQSNSNADLVAIIEHNVRRGIALGSPQEDGASGVGGAIVEFLQWFTSSNVGKRCTVSIRDILSWVDFINCCARGGGDEGEGEEVTEGRTLLEPAVAYVHGACLVFLDGLGSGSSSSADAGADRGVCLAFLAQQTSRLTGGAAAVDLTSLSVGGGGGGEADAAPDGCITLTEEELVIEPFHLRRGPAREADAAATSAGYALHARTTCSNAQRVLRALQLSRRPILLEGAPGVGKTSLVAAIARAAGRRLVRINLSEQTDVSDLFGADLPVEGAGGGHFAWRNGPLLEALEAGDWIALDELNLASQSVLEGLNACLDHRGEAYVPELGRTFSVDRERTRVFACQNPLRQGGGRKGLPRSFLNRFTQVFVEPLTPGDLLFITRTLYPTIPLDVLSKMVEFNSEMYRQTMLTSEWGQKGAPWEFNLRDVFRWCDLIMKNQSVSGASDGQRFDPSEHAGLVYAARMRTRDDEVKVHALYEATFGGRMYDSSRHLAVTTETVQVGHSFLARRAHEGAVRRHEGAPLQLLRQHLPTMEALMQCVDMRWMAILIGPQGCGKTSVVHALARLAGRTLKVLAMNSGMDTTELLGGFEQADFNRHLEPLVADVEAVVVAVVQNLLVEKSPTVSQSVASLMQRWSDFCNTGTTEGIDELQKRVLVLEADLDRQGSCNGGGVFEWVDSVLVRALRAGDWLLIDNVNFCSPSVLDRLNALLEPGGVLSMNERGVVDGHVPSVRPHRDFRLFLTMDPRHGEISRAMRNRGVEICMLGQREESFYDRCDTKLMLHNLGLVGSVPSDYLIDLNNKIRHAIYGGGSLAELLQSARLTVQHMQHGASLPSAIYGACRDVYMKNQFNNVNKKKAKEIVEACVSSLDLLEIERRSKRSSLLECATWPHPLPAVDDFASDATMATVRRDGVLLAHLLTRLSVATGQTPALSLSAHGLRDASDARMFTEGEEKETQPLDPSLNPQWVERACRRRAAGDLGGDLGHDDLDGGDRGHNDLDRDDLGCDNLDGDDLGEGRDLQATFERISRLFNAVSLLARFAQQAYDGRCHLEAEEESGGGGRGPAAVVRLGSLLRVSRAIHAGHVAADDPALPHPVVPHLYPLLRSLDDAVSACLARPEALSRDDARRLADALRWRARFWDVCAADAPRHGGGLQVALLRLHWHWLESRTLDVVADVAGQVAPALRAAAARVRELLGVDSRLLRALGKMAAVFGRPPPHADVRVADAAHNAARLCPRVAATGGRHRVRALASGNVAATRRLLLATLTAVADGGDAEWVSRAICEAESALGEAGLLGEEGATAEEEEEEEEEKPEGDTSSSSVEMKVQLWPMTDHVSLLCQVDIINRLQPDVTDTRLSVVARHVDFAMTHTPASPGHLVNLARFQEADDRSLYLRQEASTILVQHFQRLWSSTATQGIDKWLAWQQHREAEEIPQDEPPAIRLGPAALLQPVQTFSTITLLLGNQQLTEEIAVPLRLLEEKRRQFRQLSTLLWQNSALVDRNPENSRSSELVSLRRSIGHLTRCLLRVHSRSADAEPAADARQLIPQLRNTVQLLIEESSLPADLAHAAAPLCEVAGRLLVRDSDSSVVADLDQSESSFLVGLAWAYLGLLEAQLLAPRQPVDPAEKRKVKLRYAQEEIKEIETELKVRNWMHYLETGMHLITENHQGEPPSNSSTNVVDMETDEHPTKTERQALNFEIAQEAFPAGGATAAADCHPRVTHLLGRLEELRGTAAALSKMVAARPTPPQFDFIVQDLRHYLGSIGSVGKVTELLGKLRDSWQGLAEGRKKKKASVSLSVLRAWLASQEKFVQRLLTTYPLYKDLVTPTGAAIYQMMYGVDMATQAVERQIGLQALNLAAVCPSSEFSNLRQFVCLPLPYSGSSIATDSLRLAETLVSENFHQWALTLFGTGDAHDGNLLKILMTSLEHTKNDAMDSGALTQRNLKMLCCLFGKFAQEWRRQEEAAKIKEQVDASLFKYKSQTHGQELTEEQQDEVEFRKRFPEFHKEFADIAAGPTLGDDEDTTVAMETSDAEAEEATMRLPEQHMDTIRATHGAVFRGLTRAGWRAPPQRDDSRQDGGVDVRAFVDSYRLMADVVRRHARVMDADVDKHLLGSNLLMCAILHNSVSDQNPDSPLSLRKDSRPFDIYHDPNVCETVKCRPLLDNMAKRVKELLGDWPDHPVLKLLLVVIDRILGFSVASPVMRFVEGLELLLGKAQDWEQNAHRKVSLFAHLEAISHQIIEWRKLELKCWNSCLDIVTETTKQKASKWWFHVYTLVESFLSPDATTAAADEGKEEEKDGNKEEEMEMEKAGEGEERKAEEESGTITQLISSLQQFVESSPLGEFHARLDMLLAFHCQLVSVSEHDPAAASRDAGALMRVMWNTHAYYAQFSVGVAAEIDRQRAPVETALRNFVKIARWSDINFWAMKAAVEKTHRTLHKHTKQYQELGVGNIERSRGYSEHLMDLVVKQHNDIAASVTLLSDLRACHSDITNMAAEQTLPPQDKLRYFISNAQDLTRYTRKCLHQVELLLHSCPDAVEQPVTNLNALPWEQLPELCRMRRGDENWEKMAECVRDLLGEVDAVAAIADARRHRQGALLSSGDLEATKVAYARLGEVAAKVGDDLLRAFSHRHGGALTAGRSLELLRERAAQDCEEFRAWVWEVDASIQELYKRGESASAAAGDDGEESPTATEDDDDARLQQGHLVEKLHRAARADCVTRYVAAHRAAARLLHVLLGLFASLARRGFCLPAQYGEEAAEEGATQFEDIEGGGMGEGEGVKDVSEKIESEDQLDEMKKEGEEKEEEAGKQPDIKEEEHGIEMSDDFEGKTHDLEKQDGEQDENEEEEEDDENELDKEMGDLDSADADKLDEQIWGSDDEDEEEEEKKDKSEEKGAGDGKRSAPELVAKEDDLEKDEENGGEEEEKDKNEQEEQAIDEGEYEGEDIDPHHGDQEPQPEPEGLDLPDDLELDREEKEGKEEEEGEEENPYDIDKAAEEEEEEGKAAESEDKPGDEGEEKERPEEEHAEDKEDEHKDENDKRKEETAAPTETEDEEEKGENNEQPGLNPEEEEEKVDDDEEEKQRSLEMKPDEKQTEESQAVEEEARSRAAAQATMTEEERKQGEEAMESETQAPDQEEKEGVGIAETDRRQEGHTSATCSAQQEQQRAGSERQKQGRKPGKADSERSLGTTEEEPVHRRLKTTEEMGRREREEQSAEAEKRTSDLYQHIKEAKSYDAQTLDAATQEQTEQQAVPNLDEEEADPAEEGEEAKSDEDKDKENEMEVDSAAPARLSGAKPDPSQEKQTTEEAEEGEEQQAVQVEGEKVETTWIERNSESTIHTDLERLELGSQQGVLEDLEKLRVELEQQLSTWSHVSPTEEVQVAAQEAWHKYDALTGDLSRELCEQLRLVLEPTQASKLRGDFRTGKRLNMRKVIPYIASQFRKDKIWLRRTKPSKRTYQVMLAVDDSSSMADNHSKQLAFESLAVISNALTWLEVGELGVCSFGENVQLLHPFHEQFTDQSGASVMQQFSFEQKKTNIAHLLDYATGTMLNCRARVRSSNPDTSQLLLIVSDGRGLFSEGVEAVRQAVRRTQEAHVFVVFVVIDNPKSKDSILDIRVPIFKGAGQLPEITSYMEHFPFPFYVILRDINSLPATLGDALRQWFELVSASS